MSILNKINMFFKYGGLTYEKKSINALNENKPLFNGYEEFVSHCKKKLGDLNHG